MKGLAWDDEPKEYMALLAEALKRRGIELRVESSEDKFAEAFLHERTKWDFFVTDFVKRDKNDAPSMESTEEEVGANLIDKILPRLGANRQNTPIFLVTGYPQRAFGALVNLPRNVIVKSKDTGPQWVADEMIEDLKTRGVFVDHQRVFVIYGHNEDLNKGLRTWLEGYGFNVAFVEPGTLAGNLSTGVIEKMNGCGAIIALCTADDRWAVENTMHPRQNVMIELGMAIGLWRGPERLVILQQWGSGVESQAILPSDLGGILTIRFNKSLPECWEQLKSRLTTLGMNRNTESAKGS